MQKDPQQRFTSAHCFEGLVCAEYRFRVRGAVQGKDLRSELSWKSHVIRTRQASETDKRRSHSCHHSDLSVNSAALHTAPNYDKTTFCNRASNLAFIHHVSFALDTHDVLLT